LSDDRKKEMYDMGVDPNGQGGMGGGGFDFHQGGFPFGNFSQFQQGGFGGGGFGGFGGGFGHSHGHSHGYDDGY
jgi:DnaJ-class molecular chaperone